MRLKNKKTGEIGNLQPYGGDGRIWVWVDNRSRPEYRYNSLAELNAEWCDAPEEPKEWWYIDIHGPHKVTNNDEYYQQVKAASKEIGNYFSSREQAELAVRKLKAWKRLKESGFKFLGVRDAQRERCARYVIIAEAPNEGGYEGCIDDVDLIFGGEE